jgi:hypothetical protein
MTKGGSMNNVGRENLDFAGVVGIWESLPDSAHWGPVTWVRFVRGKPALVTLGDHASGEMYAVLDVIERRVVGEEELTSWDLDKYEQCPVPGCPKRG